MTIRAFLATARNWLVAATPDQPRQWFILLGIIVVVSTVIIELVYALNRPQPVASADQIPVVTVAKTTGGDKNWTTYNGQTDKFQINLPTNWHREFNSGDDPSDEYDLFFDTKPKVEPAVDPTIAKGILAIGVAEIGHGVPGPQVARINTSVGGHPALRTVWESANLRLVQYRWVWHSKNFLLQLESGTGQTAAFSTFDDIAQSVKLY